LKNTKETEMRLTSLKNFNIALKKSGFNVELVKGYGYFYYSGTDFEIPSVYVNSYIQCTPEWWQGELNSAVLFMKSKE